MSGSFELLTLDNHLYHSALLYLSSSTPIRCLKVEKKIRCAHKLDNFRKTSLRGRGNIQNSQKVFAIINGNVLVMNFPKKNDDLPKER